MKASGRLSVDTNVMIAYRGGIPTVCALIDDAIAIRYATVCLQLKKIGHPIPENGIRVAATCLELGVPPLTQDGHSDRIHNLEVINWRKYEN